MIHSLSPSWHCNGRSDFTDTVTAREPVEADPIPTRTSSFHALGWLAMAMLLATGFGIVLGGYMAADAIDRTPRAAFVAAGETP